MATFGWRRHGSWLSSDSISMNSSHFSLTLLNLTDDNTGRYSCGAQGVLALRVQHVDLFIKGSYVHMFSSFSGYHSCCHLYELFKCMEQIPFSSIMFADDQYIVIHINSFTQLNIYAIYIYYAMYRAAIDVPTRVTLLQIIYVCRLHYHSE